MLHHSKFPRFVFLALICAAVSGCSSVTQCNISSDPSLIEKITRTSETDEATITFQDGREEFKAYRIAVRPDSTEWYSEDRKIRHAVATTEVLSINFDHNNALNGSLSGALTGLAFGGTDLFFDYLFSIALWPAYFLGLSGSPGVITNVIGKLGAFTVSGAILGLMAGALGVHTTQYLVDPSVAQSRIFLMPQTNSLHSPDTTQIKLPY
jgi:hypothetical protein